MHEFVAEHYISATDADGAQRGASIARLAAEQLTREGTPVEFVRSIFIPRDETCIYIYRAGSLEAVQAALARTPLRFERVSEAVTQQGAHASAGHSARMDTK
ncbi:MAG TPA: hypothetical protein VGH56_05825 [Solirubrobacteraceae bacterium]|jgi:hypothetical protein